MLKYLQKGIKMKLKIKTSPIENKILLLLGIEGLNKEKVHFSTTEKENKKIFSYFNWLPLKNHYRLFKSSL